MGTIRLFKVWLLICIMVLSGGSLAFAQTNTFPSSGDVGIGTTGPGAKLHVSGTTDGTNAIIESSAAGGWIEFKEAGTTRGYVGYADDGGLFAGGSANSFNIRAEGDLHLGGTGDSLAMTIKSGNVGIGTTSPGYLLDLHGSSQNMLRITSKGAFGTTLTIDQDTPSDVASFNVSGTNVFTINNSGNVGIGTTSPSSKLHVAGDATIDGNIAAKYQDVAEWVRTPARLAPGTVVVIDPQENNQVLPASQAYDTRVAGVVSAQPGIILGEAGEDKAKVAHSGRVKVKADAQFGPISVGDLLVSSDTAGYAMRSTPIEMNGISIHRPGTIVGKALEPLREGQREILVFLTLQ